jgi:Type IV secretory pathway, VirB3-like protein
MIGREMLYLALTRPALTWGVPFEVLGLNAMVTFAAGLELSVPTRASAPHLTRHRLGMPFPILPIRGRGLGMSFPIRRRRATRPIRSFGPYPLALILFVHPEQKEVRR